MCCVTVFCGHVLLNYCTIPYTFMLHWMQTWEKHRVNWFVTSTTIGKEIAIKITPSLRPSCQEVLWCSLSWHGHWTPGKKTHTKHLWEPRENGSVFNYRKALQAITEKQVVKIITFKSVIPKSCYRFYSSV